MTDKATLRLSMNAKRTELDFQWLKRSSARIVENFQSLEVFQTAKTVALYKAIVGEVDLNPLFLICWALGKRTFIPVFNREEKRYDMAEVTGKTRYSTGHYGIQEPIAPAVVPMGSIMLVAVPGVAFDRKGNRLGRGGGYYDRLLDGFSGFSAAVAYGFQILPHIPSEPHDQPIDAIVTESEIINVLNER